MTNDQKNTKTLKGPIDLGGLIFLPGTINIKGAVANNGVVTLDAQGDKNATFVFNIDGPFAVWGSDPRTHAVKLINGASPMRVFWNVKPMRNLDGTPTLGHIAEGIVNAGIMQALDQSKPN